MRQRQGSFFFESTVLVAYSGVTRIAALTVSPQATESAEHYSGNGDLYAVSHLPGTFFRLL
jgi:hypothetical protein